MSRWFACCCLLMLPLATRAEPPALPSDKDVPMTANPFFETWTTPFGLPPFDRIREEHFLPAIERGIDEQRAEVRTIANRPEPATFDNTLVALDRTGARLEQVELVFHNLLGAETTPGLQAIAKKAAPLLAALEDDIYLDPNLWARVEAVYQGRDGLKLAFDDLRLLTETRKRFVRGGAALDAAGKERLRAVHQELSVLGLRFGDNLLAETNAFRLVIDRRKDLAGLTRATIEAAAEAANQAGLKGKWIFTLHGPSLWPFLQQSSVQSLRERMLTAYATRGDADNSNDNKALLTRMVQLRAEKARLLGYASWADFVLADRMAATPQRVSELLDRLWAPAVAAARREAGVLQKTMRQDRVTATLAPWDWHYYTERVRAKRFGLDDAALRPYFSLDNTLSGVFQVANRLYGLTFKEVTGLKLYHPEVRAFEVLDQDGTHLGLFLADYHPRPGKRGGAWSSRYRSQCIVDGKDIRPIVVNVGNFTRPTAQAPALLSLEEVETLFHEMGHALHSLLSKIRYQGLASVPRDFVELPSQIMENWALEPEVLALYARHYQTGQLIPADLVAKVKAAERFNQGFATTEYLAASYLDMAWHSGATPDDPRVFEKSTLDRLGLIPEILPRYRSGYFNHIFGGSGSYSAGYYSYIWSEVLDADAYAAFREKGIFDPTTARAFRTEILEKAGTADAMEMYQRFRGREPDVRPLLERRGLLPAAPKPLDGP